MKRINTYSTKAFCIICFMSLVMSICSAQDETEKTPFVPSENISVSYEYEERDMIGANEDTNNDEDNLIFNIDGKENILGVLAEIASKNVAALNDITTEGATVVVSLPETVTSEMKNEAEKLSATLNSNKSDNNNNTTSGVKEASAETISVDHKSSSGEELSNGTIVLLNKTKDTPEEIPSFSEWAQKRMEEAEKKFVNESSNVGNNGKLGSGVKLGWKNYASPDCGAKVVAANPEAVSASSVISPSREEYKLNVCTNRIWFIVELCEAIQAKKIDIANFELFSSTPKEFTVSIGDRFPSREWTTVGQFMAKDERDVQSFDLNPHLFGRYIKVEVKSHHGAQHYCPISLFRVYGISELEVLQKEDLSQVDDDDMDDNDDSEIYSDGLTKNMLNSATNAVYSMIKKAAEVLSTKSNETNKKNDPTVQFEYSPLINTCSTPRHSIVCGNCSDVLFGQVYELLSCKFDQIHKLAQVPYIRDSLIASDVCQYFGMSMNPVRNVSICNKSCLYVRSLFTDKFLAAICNNVAISENKAVLNNSQQFPNSTKTLVEENADVGAIGMSKITSGIEQSVEVVLPDNNSESRPTDELKLDLTDNVELPKVSCSTSLEYTSRIKPTKTVILDVSIESSNILSGSETEELLNHVTKVDSPAGEVNGATEAKISINDFGDVQDVGDANGHNLYVSTEPPETMDQMEHFMTDINGENGPSTVPPVSSGNNPADRQKESVFLRLSNRIKALERNVSLSSQYLEELSRRYKKQVEEMQNLERTIHSLLEERRKMEEKDKQLEERLDNLMITLEKWPSFIFWFLTTITIFCGVFWICGGERKKNAIDLPKDVKRRKSIDIITCKEKKKVRRPSDQALKIVRSSLMAEERKLSLEKRRRKRSNKCLKRSNSTNECDINGFRVNNHDTMQDSTPVPGAGANTKPGDWVEENHRQIEIVDLDESENSSLDHFATILEKEVPLYTKTAVDSRAYRISSRYIKPNINGDQDFPYTMSKEMEIVGNSPKLDLKNSERRSSLSNRSEGGSRKKERKSFRTVLKNVFT